MDKFKRKVRRDLADGYRRRNEREQKLKRIGSAVGTIVSLAMFLLILALVIWGGMEWSKR